MGGGTTDCSSHPDAGYCPQKVGKSGVVCNILGELAKGRGEFLERFALYPPSPKLIIVGTDQPLADWREVMVPNGLMVRTDLNQYKLGSSVARLYTRENGVHLDEAGIELITADCEQNSAKPWCCAGPRCLPVIDWTTWFGRRQ